MQRALWTFLFYTLVGPFLAAVAVALVSLFMGMTGASPSGITPFAWAAQTAIQAFTVGTFAMAFAGAGLAALVTLRGSIRWLEAAVAGVLAFMVIALSSGAVAPQTVTGLAFLSGCVSVLCQRLLVRIGVLPPA